MKNKIIKKPKTISELKKTSKKLYEEFLRQKNKYGITFKMFIEKL